MFRERTSSKLSLRCKLHICTRTHTLFLGESKDFLLRKSSKKVSDVYGARLSYKFPANSDTQTLSRLS